MIKRFLMACAAISLLAACQSPSKKAETEKNKNAFTTLVNEDVTQKRDVKLSELIEDFQIIRFDSRDEALFSLRSFWPYFSENYIALKCSKSPVKLFAKDGTFIHDVGGLGQGPGEYSYAYGGLINEKDGHIYLTLFGYTNYLLKYDMEGTFVGEVKFKASVNKGRLFALPDGSMALVHINMVDPKGSSSGFSHALIPTNGKDSIRYAYKPNLSTAAYFQEGNQTLSGLENEIWSYRNTADFPVMYTFSDTLYHYDMQANELVPRFAFSMNPEARKNNWFILTELPRYFYINIVGDKGRNLLVDKASGEAFEIGKFTNDFLGNMDMWPRFQDGYYFECMEPLQLMEKLEKTLASGDCPKDQVEKLTKLKNSLDENDNNILFLGKLKQ